MKATFNRSTGKKRKIDEDRKLYIAEDVDASWEKVRRTKRSHSINMIKFFANKNSKAGGSIFSKGALNSNQRLP